MILTNNYSLASIKGRLEYFLHPGWRDRWGGPFNGQKFRQQIFSDLLNRFSVAGIIETGTYRGSTTALFAETSVPVFSVERHPRYFGYSKMRFLSSRKNIHLYNGDSRTFLKTLIQDDSVPRTNVFFYLDAHWENDLPLREELEIILLNWKDSIVMVDDFKVPGSRYGFDDYGPDKSLEIKYIYPIVSRFTLAVFYPSVNSEQETGGKRGCVVLCNEKTGREIEQSIESLARSPLNSR